MKRILIIGAGGQIGSELTVYLRKIYGDRNVVATDMRECKALGEAGPFEVLNALDATAMASVVARYHIDSIFNLVALLSAVGERNPQMAWNVNMGALNNSLEVARQHHCALFTPSSIGAFGPTSPKDRTPQDTIMQPTTIYGICKVTGEMLGNYYHHKYGVDTRSVRFPGIISSVTLPGGGTTDYAVEIYYEAIRSGRFTCPVPPDVYMDMIYMPDALRACVELMEADPAKLVHRNSFNIASMSFTPEIICAEIRKRLPDFTMDYDVDPVKKEIAESWPNSLDDTCAREEWGWKPEWDLSRMTDDMLAHIRTKESVRRPSGGNACRRDRFELGRRAASGLSGGAAAGDDSPGDDSAACDAPAAHACRRQCRRDPPRRTDRGLRQRDGADFPRRRGYRGAGRHGPLRRKPRRRGDRDGDVLRRNGGRAALRECGSITESYDDETNYADHSPFCAVADSCGYRREFLYARLLAAP